MILHFTLGLNPRQRAFAFMLQTPMIYTFISFATPSCAMCQTTYRQFHRLLNLSTASNRTSGFTCSSSLVIVINACCGDLAAHSKNREAASRKYIFWEHDQYLPARQCIPDATAISLLSSRIISQQKLFTSIIISSLI